MASVPQPVEAEIQQILARWLAENASVPGMIVLVHGPDVEVATHAGFADREHSEPISTTHAFRIASNTKTFVAVAAMHLVEQGRLTLDAPVGAILPNDVRALLVRRYDLDAITVRMLLQHTSGISPHDADSHDGATSPFLVAVKAEPAHHWTAVEQIAFSIERFEPTRPPGAAMSYSDTGYIVLGQVLEHVTGASLAAVVREHAKLDALGLANTWWERFETPPSPAPARARVQLGDEDWEAVDCSIDLYGGGGLVSNVADLTAWWRALFHNEILEPETLAMMLSPLAPSEESHGGAGLGLFRRSLDGRSWWTHSGYWGSIVLHEADADLTLTAFRNQSEIRTVELEPAYAAILSALA